MNTAKNRDALRHAIDKARRAQLDEMGGYHVVERDAKMHERLIQRDAELAPQRIAKLEARVKELQKERRELRRQIAASETRNTDLSRKLKLTSNALSATRKRRDYWYTHATGHQPNEGRGAARLRSVA